MRSLKFYRIAIVLLLSLLAASTGAWLYYYEARTNDLNDAISHSSNLDNQITSLTSQIDSLQVQIAAAQNANQNNLEARVTVLESVVAKLNATINRLQATTQAQSDEITALKSQVQDLQTEINNLQPVVLNAAGASFPLSFLTETIMHYSTLHPNVHINYNAVGSGGGVSAFTAKTIDFGGTDVPLTSAQASAVPNALHIPETIDAIAVAYDLPDVSSGLDLNSSAIAAIFQGNITMWNDPLIQQLNPALTLPNAQIIMVHRSDASGDTAIFTKYLQSTAIVGKYAWKLGSGNVVNWQSGSLGASENIGVAGVIQGTQYTIGYVELTFALVNHMSISSILNGAGSNFVLPSLASVQYSVMNSTETNAFPAGDQSWSSASLLNSPGGDSYPIVSLTYLIVYKELNVLSDLNLRSAQTLVDFLWFVVHDGQNFASSLSYPSLTSNVVNVDEATIESITFNGQVVHPPPPPLTVNVIAQQFSYSFSCSSPCDTSTAGALTIPHGTSIILNVTSADVLHTLSIPTLRITVDAIKGQYLVASFTAPIGTYTILCLELCGAGHGSMRATLNVT